MSYGETVTHNVNLSQFDNRGALVKFVKQLPQQTGFKTMTFLGIDEARCSPETPFAPFPMSLQISYSGESSALQEGGLYAGARRQAGREESHGDRD